MRARQQLPLPPLENHHLGSAGAASDLFCEALHGSSEDVEHNGTR